MNAIETNSLVKTYPSKNSAPVEALRGVSFAVHQGHIYALLGPNGAGKTTLISILTTLTPPTSGQARVAGFDVVTQTAEVRRRLGVTFQEIVLDADLTGRQALEFHARLYGLDRPTRRQRIDALARLVDLSDVLDRKVGTYSGGMKRRLELARGLLSAPQVLFLDEPTQGLDPQNRAGIWRYIRRLRDEEGITLLLTTHYMEEAEALADRVGIIDHGQLIVEGAPADLIGQMGADVITLSGAGDAGALDLRLRALPFVAHSTLHTLHDGVCFQIGVDSGERRLAEIIAVALGASFVIQQVTVSRPSLGDVFLAYTGEQLRDE
ncbi:MAG: ATP-binding cassette domain-containing protein [Caldilinea sp.]|jgi:ABC-2 type transport system ATP-binding protein|nr:ATP-binding cassette domain-containing protein [Caldilinea sp.]